MTKGGDNPPVVCFEGVDFAYDGAVAIEGADFDIYPGESVCVVGPNGGGKTTLVKLMLGLLAPDRGRVRLFGRPPKRTRSRVGYVPQQSPHDPLLPVRAREVVLTGLLRPGRLGPARKEERERAAATLDRLGAADLAEQRFAGLSGGQRQTVLVARALVGAPDLLVLDEPTANVDAAGETRVREALRREGREATLVTVSHDLNFVSRWVPKAVCVNREVRVHPTAELTAERARELYGADLRLVRHAEEHADGLGGHRHPFAPEGGEGDV